MWSTPARVAGAPQPVQLAGVRVGWMVSPERKTVGVEVEQGEQGPPSHRALSVDEPLLARMVG